MRATSAITGVLMSAVLIAGAASTMAYAEEPAAPSTGTPTSSPTIAPNYRPTVDTAYIPRTVGQAQKRLNAIGCDAGTVDGTFDDHTESAIIRFQAANRLSQTGSLGTVGWDKLLSTSKIACNRRPVPSSSGSGRRIVVSRTQNWVWLVNSDGTIRHQGGLIDNPSVWPTGSYRMGSACGRPAHILHNSDYEGGLTLDYFSRLQTGLCGVAFHRVPRYKGTETQIHPNWMLGTNFRKSHGCMRVSITTAKAIWDFSQTSTTVVVKG